MFYNLHDDIGNDIYNHRFDIVNRLDEYHYPKLKKGRIKKTVIVCYFKGDENFKLLKEMVLYVNDQINKSKYFSFSDNREISVVIGIEGMCAIKNDYINSIKWLKEHNVKIASLVWNECNHLACGCKSGNQHISVEGIDVIRYLNDNDIVIDVSHLCEKGVYDVLRYSYKPIVATHSNAYCICPHLRNLSDEIILQIIKKGGVIGIVAIKGFVSEKVERQNLMGLFIMIEYVRRFIGDDNIAFGFDFMDYFSEENLMIAQLQKCEDCANLYDVLLEKYDDRFVNKICYDNINDFLER